MAGPDAFAKFKGPVSLWVRSKSNPDGAGIYTFMELHFGDGHVRRYMRNPSNNLAWVSLGDHPPGNYMLELQAGDLCG